MPLDGDNRCGVQRVHRGSGRSTRARRSAQHGSPSRAQTRPRRAWRDEGVGGARSTWEAGNDRGGKEPWFRRAFQAADETEIGVSGLSDGKTKLEELQGKLYAKAKAEPQFRFYSLYDKIYRADVLAEAYRKAKANRGAPGVDGQTFEQIEESGKERWLTFQR
jgi:hypothetical protein